VSPRNRTSFPSAVLARLLTIALLCSIAIAASAAPRRLIHKPAPPFVRTDLQGRPVDISALKGRVVLLSFWATWCEPCQAEMPRFIDWQTRYGPRGLQVIGVSMDDNDAPVRALASQRGVNYTVLMGDAKLARLYGGILGLPVTFLIDRQGRIATRFKGQSDLDAMDRTLRRLLDSR
jgi:cytochrome c biogenesis protein CcmG/thiol:disulfide interchange protein DsbE